MRISVEDVDYADLLIHLPSAIRFIDKALREHGIVLVHCVQGLSRSAAVVAAYCETLINILAAIVLTFFIIQ
jgi:dual specificity phosphatase 12